VHSKVNTRNIKPLVVEVVAEPSLPRPGSADGAPKPRRNALMRIIDLSLPQIMNAQIPGRDARD
jgi:hypothetical protein